MNEAVVTDSTCLIGLERINRLDLLPALFDIVWIPPEVEREFGISYDWLHVEAPTDTALVNALKLMVDDGEAEAIALASEKQLKIIVDDRQVGTATIHFAAKRGLCVSYTLLLIHYPLPQSENRDFRVDI